MDKEYSDSLIPLGIGGSFFLFLLILLALGALAGLYFEDKLGFQQLGGVPLLVAILIILVGPKFYNKKESRFERGKKIVDKYDFFGTVQGLRGAFIRLLLYADGIEIRAFYHRYYIPFIKFRYCYRIET